MLQLCFAVMLRKCFLDVTRLSICVAGNRWWLNYHFWGEMILKLFKKTWHACQQTGWSKVWSRFSNTVIFFFPHRATSLNSPLNVHQNSLWCFIILDHQIIVADIPSSVLSCLVQEIGCKMCDLVILVGKTVFPWKMSFKCSGCISYVLSVH